MQRPSRKTAQRLNLDDMVMNVSSVTDRATELAAQLAQASSVLVVSHISPDGDAIGSLLAMGAIVDQVGTPVVLGIADTLPDLFRFLPGHQRIVRQAAEPFDLIIALDASDPQRLGDLFSQHVSMARTIINIDHHATNIQFGTLNWIDPRAAATAEMLYQLAITLAVPLSPELATSLLTGIVTDTRGFRTSSTTAATLTVAADLMNHGAALYQIMDVTLERRSLAGLRLWGDALRRTQRHGRVVWSQLTTADRTRNGVSDNRGDTGLSGFLLTANEADVAILFTERNGAVEVSMRARPGFDVAQAALALGGGGHPQAAGCTVPGPLPRARSQVMAAVDLGLARQGYPQPLFEAALMSMDQAESDA